MLASVEQQKMAVACFANRKGGVGKTLSTYYTGRWLAKNGRDVQLLDVDPQRGLWDIASLIGHEDGVLAKNLRVVERDAPKNVDWRLVDTPPALDGSMPELRDADYLIVPVFPEAQEVSQLDKFLNMLDKTRQYRPFTQVIGVLPVRYVKRWEANRVMLDHIKGLATDYGLKTFEPVPWSSAVSKYSLRGGLWRHVADYLLRLER